MNALLHFQVVRQGYYRGYLFSATWPFICLAAKAYPPEAPSTKCKWRSLRSKTMQVIKAESEI